MTIAYLNGKYLPLEQAQVPVLDRGFLFGDGVYEVIPIYNHHPFHLQAHLARLRDSLAAIKLTLFQSDQELHDIIKTLISKSTGENLSCYLQITRGSYSRRKHAFAENIKPTILAYATPIETPSADRLTMGFKAITIQDIRWPQCHVKSTSLLANVLLHQQAIEAGADEAILIRGNNVIEGSSSNIFVVKDGILFTPPKTTDILGGITRQVVMQLATAVGMAVCEKSFTKTELFNSQEIWLTSSTRGIWPIIEVDEQPIGNAEPGEFFHRINQAYQQLITHWQSEMTLLPESL